MIYRVIRTQTHDNNRQDFDVECGIYSEPQKARLRMITMLSRHEADGASVLRVENFRVKVTSKRWNYSLIYWIEETKLDSNVSVSKILEQKDSLRPRFHSQDDTE